MAHDVLHMVCLGTHPCGSLRIIASSPRIHPIKIKITISIQAFWVFEALVLPSTDRNTLELVFYFLVKIKDQRKNFCSYFLQWVFEALPPALFQS